MGAVTYMAQPEPKVKTRKRKAGAANAAQNTGKSNLFTSTILPLVIVLIGVTVAAYPMVAMQWNNYRQGKIAEAYANSITSQRSGDVEDQIARAHVYNEANLGGPAYDPWTGQLDTSSPEYQDYLSQLNLVETMSQLVIPTIGVNLPIYHGTEAETLDKGIGHLFGSSLPVGGENTHAVLTGHTGLTNSTLFDNLIEVKLGDAFYLNTYGEKMKYVVDDIQTVLPDETDSLRIAEGRDLVTLITCTPYGINSHRLLVTGTRVPMDPEEEKQAFESGNKIVWTWWMLLSVAAIVLIALVLLLLVVRAIIRRIKKNSHVSGE